MTDKEMQYQPTEIKTEVIRQQPMIQQPQETDSFALMPNQHQIAQYSEYLKNFNAFLDSNLKAGVDYGTIPGVSKPSLFKPGAEKLEKLLSLRHEKVLVEKMVEPGYTFVKYSYKTIIYNKRNEIAATCEGSCNSKEKKYRYQYVNGKLEDKKDFYDAENTIMKMAQKRSYVGAMLEATNSSGRFTQDVEDMSPEALRSANHNYSPTTTATVFKTAECSACGAIAKKKSGEKNGKPWAGVFCTDSACKHVDWKNVNQPKKIVDTEGEIRIEDIPFI